MNVETYGKIRLVNADCMEVMRGLPDNAFDLAICDPPYGLGIDRHKGLDMLVQRTNRANNVRLRTCLFIL